MSKRFRLLPSITRFIVHARTQIMDSINSTPVTIAVVKMMKRKPIKEKKKLIEKKKHCLNLVTIEVKGQFQAEPSFTIVHPN